MLDRTDLSAHLSDPSLLVDRAYVAGEWISADSGASFPVTNPARGDVICTVPDLSETEVTRAIEAAHSAQKGWAAKTGKERSAVLRKWYDLMVANADDLAAILTAEMGKPLADATGEIKNCASTMKDTLEGIAAALSPEILEDEHTRSTMHFDPLGVAGVIAPWNFPLAMPHWMVMPSLMAGNTVVLKPSEETPLIAQAYADILNESLPQDVLQVIHGADKQGAALVDANVDLIAFTGSRNTGSKMARFSLPRKPVATLLVPRAARTRETLIALPAGTRETSRPV